MLTTEEFGLLVGCISTRNPAASGQEADEKKVFAHDEAMRSRIKELKLEVIEAEFAYCSCGECRENKSKAIATVERECGCRHESVGRMPKQGLKDIQPRWQCLICGKEFTQAPKLDKEDE